MTEQEELEVPLLWPPPWRKKFPGRDTDTSKIIKVAMTMTAKIIYVYDQVF